MTARYFRHRGISWAPVLFLLSFLAAVAVVAWFWMEPTLRIANEGSPEQRQRLAAYSALLVAVLILVLLVGLVITLRIGRSVRMLSTTPRKPTVYPDAWSESAKRTPAPSVEELEGTDTPPGDPKP